MSRLLLAAALLAAGCTTAAPKPAPPPAANAWSPWGSGTQGPIGQPLELALPGLHGGTTDLASRKGKVLLVDFWATWCEPCHEAGRAYDKLREQLGPRGLEVYGVSVDEDRAQVESFIRTEKVGYPILLDPAAELGGPKFGISNIPSVVVVDREGVIRFLHAGYDAETLDAVKTELESLLGP